MRKREEQYVISEYSITRFINRIIGIGAIIYLAINFNEHQDIYGIIIFIIVLFLIVLDESYTLKINEKRLEISRSNILKIFTVNQTFRLNEIEKIEFIPSKFSLTIFILNRLIRYGANSQKESRLIIYKKNGESIELKNIGSEDEAKHLQQWLLSNS